MTEKKQREIEFIPLACTRHELQDDDGVTVRDSEGNPVMVEPTFSGKIVLRMPSFDERYEALEQVGLQVDAKGEVTISGGGLSMLRKLVAASRKFYLRVELKKLATGEEYSCYEDLDVDPDCDQILGEVAKIMRQGFRPGKR